jgi:hypothetical protein
VLALDDKRVICSQASGFFFDESGAVLTNFHVIDGYPNLVIKLSDGTSHNVTKILAQHPDLDLAIVATATPKEKSIPLAIADHLPDIGSNVSVIGTPRGFSLTLSTGILSGKRKIDNFDFIQTTAPVSPGSSGSPVFDENGKILGMIAFNIKESQNLNLAICYNEIRNAIHNRPFIRDTLDRYGPIPSGYEIARPGDTIFSEDRTKTEPAFCLDEPINSTMPGAYGIHFNFSIDPGVLRYVHENDTFVVFASSSAKATFMGGSVISENDTVGIFFRKSDIEKLSWFVDNTEWNGGIQTVWTRDLKPEEYGKIRKCIVPIKGTKTTIFSIKYDGYKFGTIDFSKEIRTGESLEAKNISILTEAKTDIAAKIDNKTIDIIQVFEDGIIYKWTQ